MRQNWVTLNPAIELPELPEVQTDGRETKDKVGNPHFLARYFYRELYSRGTRSYSLQLLDTAQDWRNRKATLVRVTAAIVKGNIHQIPAIHVQQL